MFDKITSLLQHFNESTEPAFVDSSYIEDGFREHLCENDLNNLLDVQWQPKHYTHTHTHIKEKKRIKKKHQDVFPL